jgi:NAD(P)-dependent dehydrogenase (short-subunit alcohol dehydrogenase family)
MQTALAQKARRPPRSLLLTGKVALVTGGSRGLGTEIALALAEEEAAVAITYIASAAKAEAVVHDLTAKGVRAAAFKADQGDPSQSEALIRAVIKKFGGLDILVNNAAGAIQGETIDSPDVDNVARSDVENQRPWRCCEHSRP